MCAKWRERWWRDCSLTLFGSPLHPIGQPTILTGVTGAPVSALAFNETPLTGRQAWPESRAMKPLSGWFKKWPIITYREKSYPDGGERARRRIIFWSANRLPWNWTFGERFMWAGWQRTDDNVAVANFLRK